MQREIIIKKLFLNRSFSYAFVIALFIICFSCNNTDANNIANESSSILLVGKNSEPGNRLIPNLLKTNLSRSVIAAYTDGKILTLINLSNLKKRWSIEPSHYIRNFEFIGNREDLVGASENKISIYDAKSGKVIRNKSFPNENISCLIPNNNYMIVLLLNETTGNLDVVKIPEFEKIFSLKDFNPVYRVGDISNKYNELAIGFRKFAQREHGIALLNLENGELNHCITLKKSPDRILFSENGELMATCAGGVIQVWKRGESDSHNWILLWEVNGEPELKFLSNVNKVDYLYYVSIPSESFLVKVLDLKNGKSNISYKTPLDTGEVLYDLDVKSMKIAVANAGGSIISVHNLDNSGTKNLKVNFLMPDVIFNESTLYLADSDGHLKIWSFKEK